MGQEDTSRLNELATGLLLPEGLRWHDDRLWFSDIEARRVYSVDLDGSMRIELELDDNPSGLGWLPDGTLLVVSMRRQQILAVVNGRSVLHADLSGLALAHANDMIVDAQGRAYVGSMGYDLWAGERFKPGNICTVGSYGSARVVADGLAFPNGMAICDNRTLIVAESVAGKLTAFDIAADGDLRSRRTWAAMDSETPDGIALEESGTIWVAGASSGSAIRCIRNRGAIQRIALPTGCTAYCVAIGGPKKNMLFIGCSSPFSPCASSRMASRPGVIKWIDLAVVSK
jgi:sugar lactone lactonase YvrE